MVVFILKLSPEFILVSESVQNAVLAMYPFVCGSATQMNYYPPLIVFSPPTFGVLPTRAADAVFAHTHTHYLRAVISAAD